MLINPLQKKKIMAPLVRIRPTPLHLPLSTKTAAREVILARTGFIDRVRRWYYRNIKRVTVQTPQVSLSAISKTIELEGVISLIYCGGNKCILPIQIQI